MTDLVERHKPREDPKSATRRVRNVRVSVTTPVRPESEDSPLRTEQIGHTLVDQQHA
jgi:hypothetical protein